MNLLKLVAQKLGFIPDDNTDTTVELVPLPRAERRRMARELANSLARAMPKLGSGEKK